MENYTDYISLNYDEMNQTTFTWTVTDKESELIQEASKIVKQVFKQKNKQEEAEEKEAAKKEEDDEEEDEEEDDEEKPLKKSKSVFSWAKKNPTKTIIYSSIVAIVFAVGMSQILTLIHSGYAILQTQKGFSFRRGRS